MIIVFSRYWLLAQVDHHNISSRERIATCTFDCKILRVSHSKSRIGRVGCRSGGLARRF